MTPHAIAKMIDHAVLHPTGTDSDLRKHCAMAVRLDIAAVCVKPFHTTLASTLLHGSGVRVCAVVGFPHGNSSPGIKAAETREVLEHGATEVDMVVNIGKVIQEDWEYVQYEIQVLQNACLAHGAILKVIFETDYVTSERLKIRLCEICSAIGTAFVKTSTGFGIVPAGDGHYTYTGATAEDVRLMRSHCAPHVEVKASGGIRTLDDLLALYALGATRFGTSSTEAILQEAQLRFGA